jgi:putative membrane protein
MKHLLSDADRALLDKRILEFEEHTGAQIVLASIVRSDSYAEIPWKAFAIGVSLASLLMIVLNLFVLGWISNMSIMLSLAAIPAFGILLALLSLLIPGLARLMVSPQRMETEARQYSQSLFLSHELFATKDRRGILLMLSQFERQVVILPDTGIGERLNSDVLNEIISIMTGHLKEKDLRQALESGLDGIRAALGSSETAEAGLNELSDEIIEEEGA